jgi:hypothetical protein
MKTVRVRVFVSVAQSGHWSAYGDAQAQVPEKAAVFYTGHAYGDAGYWIEADLPLPNQAPEIVATVTRA